MEDKIYQVLRKHKLPLKKREELMPDLLALFRNECEQNKSPTRKLKKERYTAVESIDHLASLLNGCFRDIRITYNSNIMSSIFQATYTRSNDTFAICSRKNKNHFDLFIPKEEMHKNSYAQAISEKRLTIKNF